MRTIACRTDFRKGRERAASGGTSFIGSLLLLLLVAMACRAVAGDAAVGDPPGSILAFDIPAQPLVSALQAFGERTGIQVLYESHSAAGRRSVAVVGHFEPEAALSLLLSATDLKIQFSGERAITIAGPVSGDDVPRQRIAGSDMSLGTMQVRASQNPREQGVFNEYNQSIQTDIEQALYRNVATRSGSYRFTVGLWLDPQRTVRRAEILQSTGQQERDAAVVAALRGLVVSRTAPDSMPQPVRVVVVVRSMQ